jgi:putative peptide zinc metalloprotease protein
MVEETAPAPPAERFWQAVTAATDLAAYRPARNPDVEVARLQGREGAYYVLKEPQYKNYLRLSEQDYAVWWQMDGRHTFKDLLFYNLKRYRTLPVNHLTNLVGELKQGGFLQEKPVNIYTHLTAALAERDPARGGRRLVDRFFNTEFALTGLDDLFTPLYRRLRWLYTPVFRLLTLLVVLVGAVLFFDLYRRQQFALSAGGGFGFLTFIAANLIVIGIHEMAHGLMTKHVGRELNRGGFLLYWGMPSFFVDTRDCWLASSKQRIAVSWAGPYSGLVIGALLSGVLTAVAQTNPAQTGTLWAGFLYQMTFLAYLSAFVNLNPLLELDGYFMLIDWLEMPGLRGRAFQFLRHELWPRLRQHPQPVPFWRSLDATERIFTLFGTLALIYSALAIWLALSFWQSRLLPAAAHPVAKFALGAAAGASIHHSDYRAGGLFAGKALAIPTGGRARLALPAQSTQPPGRDRAAVGHSHFDRHSAALSHAGTAAAQHDLAANFALADPSQRAGHADRHRSPAARLPLSMGALVAAAAAVGAGRLLVFPRPVAA